MKAKFNVANVLLNLKKIMLKCVHEDDIDALDLAISDLELFLDLPDIFKGKVDILMEEDIFEDLIMDYNQYQSYDFKKILEGEYNPKNMDFEDKMEYYIALSEAIVLFLENVFLEIGYDRPGHGELKELDPEDYDHLDEDDVIGYVVVNNNVITIDDFMNLDGDWSGSKHISNTGGYLIYISKCGGSAIVGVV